MTLEDVQQELERAATLLAEARSALHEGQDFDIAQFNEVVTSACRNAIKLPSDEASTVRPTLRSLLDELEVLRAEVEVVENVIRQHAEAVQDAAGKEAGQEAAEAGEDAADTADDTADPADPEQS